MYTLIDTFNNTIISRHRTLKAAVKAEFKYSDAVKRSNGLTSYIPMRILDNGKRLTELQLDEAYGRVW